MITKEDFEWVKKLLPARYQCEMRDNAILCKSDIGICDDHMIHDKYDPETDNQWMLITKAMEQKWGDRLLEINSIEPQTHSKFKIYLR